MPNTFTLIASSTVGAGGASSIDFTSIPSTYTDLQLFCSLRSAAAVSVGYPALKVNGVTTNQSMRTILGTGSAASSGTDTLFEWWASGTSGTASTFTNDSFYFANYANTSYNKSISKDTVQENNGTAAYMEMNALLWSSTAAISSLSLYIVGGANFAQYSSAYLYGVKNA